MSLNRLVFFDVTPKILVFYQFRPPTSLTSLILKINKEVKKVKTPVNTFRSYNIGWAFEDSFLLLLLSNDIGAKEYNLC